MQCSECRHYKNSTNYRRPNGTCHKSAPKAAAVQVPVASDEESQIAFVAVWPEVPRDESCGDFEPVERRTAPEEPRSSLPPEPKPERPEPKSDPRPLPSAKEALEAIHEYLAAAINDFDAYNLVVQTQTREVRPTGLVWRVETRYDDNSDYVFVIGPDGIIEMT